MLNLKDIIDVETNSNGCKYVRQHIRVTKPDTAMYCMVSEHMNIDYEVIRIKHIDDITYYYISIDDFDKLAEEAKKTRITEMEEEYWRNKNDIL